jgi:hypothetical protein
VKPGTESGAAALKGKQKIQPVVFKKSTQLIAAGFPANAAASVVTDLTAFIASNTPRSANPQVKETKTMFSVNQKRHIAGAVQQILRATNHPELPTGEIQFSLHVQGAQPWSWANIKNNEAVLQASVNSWNERQDPTTPTES